MLRSRDHRRSQAHRISVLRASFLRQVDGNQIRVSFASCFNTHLGLRLRDDEAQQCIRRVFAAFSSSGWNSTLLAVMYASETADLIEGKLDDLAEALTRIAWRPLTPRLVRAALGISGQERAHWTKDGRLPSSGQETARRGHLFSIPTYSVEIIENLASHSEIITAWREQDAAAQARRR
jgi:hypothetical protein